MLAAIRVIKVSSVAETLAKSRFRKWEQIIFKKSLAGSNGVDILAVFLRSGKEWTAQREPC